MKHLKKKKIFGTKFFSSTSSNKLLDGKKVSIIGGGPGGLTLAKILQDRGIDVKIYEREKNRAQRIQGGSLDMHSESGLKAIKEANLEKQFEKLYLKQAESTTVADHNAQILFQIPSIKILPFRPEIERGDLRDLFLDSLRPGTVEWDHHFTSLKQLNNNKIEISFENGKKIESDLVIGSDGAHSKTRQFLTNSKPIYTGICLIQGELKQVSQTLPQFKSLINDGALFCLGQEKAIIAHSQKNDRMLYYVSFRKAKEEMEKMNEEIRKDPLYARSYLEKKLREWNQLFHQLFLLSQPTFVFRPIFETGHEDIKWETNHNLTLLGDAAHLMAPFAGEGANIAMHDSLELANSLTSQNHATIHSSLISFEQKMFERFSKKKLETKFGEDILHSPNASQQIFKIFLGPFASFKNLIPPLFRGLNKLTDFIGVTK